MENHGRAVVLFRGDPRRDERQKRLPRRFLSTLHVALLKTIGRVPGVDVLVASDVGEEFRLGEGRWQLDSLGERIEAAIEYSFSSGYSRVLLLAGDIADLRTGDIDLALRALEGSARSAVIGSSGDGGFFAVGFSQPPTLDWTRLLHDRQCAGAALTDALRADGFTITHLAPVNDVDSRADAARIVRHRRPSRELLRLIAALASLLRDRVTRPFLRHSIRDAALAFSSTFRGPPESRSPL